MADLLVKLYELPDLHPYLQALKQKKIVIRKPIGPENYAVIAWIRQHFEAGWASEAENAFFRSPKGIYIAVQETDGAPGSVLGFACWDATARGLFGPTGVMEKARGQGIGAALLLACLYAMKEEGYAYGIIGGAGPVAFYEKICNAVVIPDSVPGIYGGMLDCNVERKNEG